MPLELIHLWTGPLPSEHIWVNPDKQPSGISKIARLYFRKWFIHPLKRRLAKYYLVLLKKFFGIKIIGITGSAGKTTTKEMLLSVLSQTEPTVASYANYDPVYNIPTTILRCTPNTKFLILEMSIEYIGEMTFYSWLVRPDIAIITNVNLTHTEFFKDIKTVGYEKGLIGVNASTALIITNDPNIQINTSAPVYKVQVKSAQLTKDFTTKVELPNFKIEMPIIGTHLSQNVALVVQTAKLLGLNDLQTKDGLLQFKPAPHRLEVIKTQKYGIIIDDSYNANPLAVKASINTLVTLAKLTKKTPVLVFGQMNELGKHEQLAHQEIAKYIQKNKIRYLFTLGPATTKIGKHFENQENLTSTLKQTLTPRHLTLIKGSRSWKLENVVSKLI